MVKLILSVSICAKLVQEGSLKGDQDLSSYIGKDDQFLDRLIANYTGNHVGRKCGIKVPTAPGQPVRG